jgi:hypothetical protein
LLIKIIACFLILGASLNLFSQEIQFNTNFTSDTVLFPFEGIDKITELAMEGTALITMYYRTIIKFLFLLIILSTQINSFSQDWPKIYGDNVDAYVKKVFEDYDKGFIIGGDILANPNKFKYAWLIKTDINGNELWDKKYGNGIDQNIMTSCVKTPDFGIIASGLTTIEDLQFDPFFFKLNNCGEVEWCKILISQGYNAASDIVSVEDGYVGMLKYYQSDSLYARICLVKLNLEGVPQWIQYLAQEDTLIYNEEGYFLYLTSDSNYLVSGCAYHPGFHPFWIMTDKAGIQIWDLFWGYLGQANRLIEKDPGIFYSTCWGIGSSGPQSPILLKFDKDGNPIDSYYLMGDTIGAGSATEIAEINDTCLSTGVAWKTPTYPAEEHLEIFLTDTLGNVLSRRLLLNEYQEVIDIIKTFDHKIIAIGQYVVDNNWDIYMWKMNTNLEDDTLYTQPLTYDSLCPYEIQSDTVDFDCGVFVNIDEIPTKEEYESTIKISPNPARDWIVLTFPDIYLSNETEVVIYNIFGQEVMKTRAVPQNRTVSLNISSLPTGVYLATCRDSKPGGLTGKFVVAR